MSKKKIESLTQEQKDATVKWRDMNIKIGFASGDGTLDEAEVRRLTDAHREMHNYPAAKKFTIMSSPYAAKRKFGKDGVDETSAFFGNQDIHWLGYYGFWRAEVGLIEETEKSKYLHQLCNHVSWFWMNREETIVCPLPIAVRTIMGKMAGRDVEGNDIVFPSPILHSFDQKVIEWADGEGSYGIYGTRIPHKYAWIVTTPAEELDVQRVLDIKDADIKAAAIKKIGIDKLLDRLDKKSLGSKTFPVGGTYTLWSVNIPGQPEPDKFLQMQCPSKRDFHVHMVDPRCNTVDQAIIYHMPYDSNGNLLSDEQIFSPGATYIEPESQS